MKISPWFVLLFLLKFSNSIGQLPDYFIPIDEFKDVTLTKFNKLRGQPIDITHCQAKAGFVLLVTKELKVFSVLIKGKTNAFTVAPKKETEGGNYNTAVMDVYSVTKPFDENGVIEIQICTDEAKTTCKTYKLKVTGLNENCDKVPPTQEDCCYECTPITIVSDKCPTIDETFSNAFGEDTLQYDKHKIVYLYDFNNDFHKRALYKITMKNKGRRRGVDWYDFGKLFAGEYYKKALKTRVANLNRERLHPRSQVEVKILNVNKFLYDINISGEDVSYDSKPSILFRELFIGDSTGLLGKLIGAFSSGVSTTAAVAKGPADPQSIGQKSLKENHTKLQCVLKNLNVLYAESLRAYSPCDTFPCCRTNSIIKGYRVIADQLIDIKIGLAQLQDSLLTVQDAKAKVDIDLKKCNDIDSQIAALLKKKTPTDGEKKVLDSLNKIKCSAEKVASIKSDIKKLERTIKSMSALIELNAKIPPDLELRKLSVFLQHVTRANQTHVSGPYFPSGNRLDLSITVQSKDTIPRYFGIPTFSNTISSNIPIVRKAFVSFSSGSFLSQSDRLLNKTYAWQHVPFNGTASPSDTVNFILVESGYTQRPMGFAALGNVEWKLGRAIGVGGSFGAGITIEREPRPAYMAGGSLFLGDFRQFAFTYGIIGMNVNQLNSNLKAVSDQQVQYKTRPADPTYYKEFKVGGFFSITYTPFIAGGKKQNQTKTNGK